MTDADVVQYIGPDVGVFVGGSTDWKLATLYDWAALAQSRGAWCHVGRVNSVRRIRLCHLAGVDSFDGTSASRYSVELPKLERARRQPALDLR